MQLNDFNQNIEGFAQAMRNDKDFELQARQIEAKTINLPAGMRTPTAEELKNMDEYAKQYRKQKPKASKREIRRAVQRKFNVQLLPNT